MKSHLIAALREEYAQWEELIAGMSERQISTPPHELELSLKDEIAHLWAWQQRTNARLTAAIEERDPTFPAWLPAVDPEAEEATDAINGWIYEANRERTWEAVYHDWRVGFQQVLDSAEKITERDLLDASRYAWLDGQSLAAVLIGTYDHHHEHLESIQN
jgi:hypothetical protein